MREIFTDIGSDGITPKEKAEVLPYRDGATFRSVREPLFGSSFVKESSSGNLSNQDKNMNGYFGKGGKLNSAPTGANGYTVQNIGNAPYLPSTAVTVSGKQYSFEMLTVLNSYEGDFDGDGKRGEIAFIIGGRTRGTSGNRSDVLLLCVGDALYTSALTVVSILYESSPTVNGTLFNSFKDWVGRTAIVCADVDGNGVDEIITTTPVNKYSTGLGITSDGFVKQANAMIWSVAASSKGTMGWKTNTNWNNPKEVSLAFNNMQNGGGHIGGLGTTVSLAAGDIDRDGREDVVAAVSCVNIGFTDIQQKASMSSLSVLYGNKMISGIVANYTPHFSLGLGGSMYRSAHGALGSGVLPHPQMNGALGVSIADMDGTGQLSVLVAYKEISGYGGQANINYYDAQYFGVSCLDYQQGRTFTATQIKRGGLSYRKLSRTNPLQTAAMNVAALGYNYGNNGQYAVGSGSIIVDGVIFSFTKRLNGGVYTFDTKYEERVVSDVKSPNPGPGETDDPETPYKVPNDYYYDNTDGYDKLWYLKPEWKECIGNFDDKYYSSIVKIRSASVTGSGDGFIIQSLVPQSSVPPGQTGVEITHDIKYYDCTKSGGTKSAYKTNSYLAKSMTYNTYPANGNWGSSFVAMPDLDNDGVWLTYKNKHEFFWSDPVIVAALASPPYFSALPGENWQNSTTTYGKTSTAGTGTSSSFTTTTGTVIATEVSAGILGVSGKWETEQESTKAMTSDAEQMNEIAHTSSFSTVGGENTVVLTTAAYDGYRYTIHYPNEDTGQTATSDFTVLIPRGGASALKVASVNYEDYEKMRPFAKEALPDLSNVFKHTVGKPETYPASEVAAITGVSTAPNSTIISQDFKTFPANSGSQSLGIEITKTNTGITASSYSITNKNGGGFNADGNFQDVIGIGSSYSTSSVYGTEKEYGKISSNAVGISFEGEVYGQNDGINASGTGLAKADFNWRLFRYVYSNRSQASSSNGSIALQEFPVITYVIPSVTQPGGAIASGITITLPAVAELTQVSWKSASNNFIETLTGFSVTAAGIEREAHTKLIGAPLGMSFVPKNENVGVSTPFPFAIAINANVKPGVYPLQLEIGGLASDTFNVTVIEAPTPPELQATDDNGEISIWNFGKARFDKISNVGEKYVYINNISAESAATGLTIKPLNNFEITRGLSSSTIEPDSYDYIVVRPKTTLTPGTYTENVLVYNATTFTSVTLTFTVTGAETPGVLSIANTETYSHYPNFTLRWNTPEDNGGSAITGYEVTVDDGEPIVVTENEFPFTAIEGEYATHLFRVRAINALGTSSHTAQYSWEYAENVWARIWVTRTDGNRQTMFYWNDPGETLGGKTLAGYEISTDNGTTWRRDYLTIGGSSYRFFYTGLTNGQIYTVKLRQYYTDDTTGPVTTATAEPTAANALPVKNLKAEARDGKVILSWDAPEPYTDDDPYGYSVQTNGGSYHGVGGLTYRSIRRTDGNGYNGTPLVNGQQYVFVVRSYSGSFMDGTDSYVVCTPQAGIPDEPGYPKNVTTRFNNDGELHITWNAPDDGGSEILYYELGTHNEDNYWNGNWYNINWEVANSDGLSYYDFPTDGKTSLSFVLRATNAVGAGDYSSWINAGGIKFNGKKTLTLPVGYNATDAGKYILENYECITESEDPEIPCITGYVDYSENYTWSLKSSDTDKITWDNSEQKIKIAEGLPPGVYKAVLQAAWWSNGDVDWLGNAYYKFEEFNFTLTVCTPPVITTSSLPNGLLENVYSCLPLNAGIGDVAWEVVSGNLPDGLTLSADGNITGITQKEGTFTFTVRATNSAGYHTKQLSIKIESDVTTDTSTGKAVEAKLYPNPVRNEIFIKSDLQVNKVEICSLTGGVLIQENNFNERISVSGLPAGVYMAKIHTDKGVLVRKFVKK